MYNKRLWHFSSIRFHVAENRQRNQLISIKLVRAQSSKLCMQHTCTYICVVNVVLRWVKFFLIQPKKRLNTATGNKPLHFALLFRFSLSCSCPLRPSPANFILFFALVGCEWTAARMNRPNERNAIMAIYLVPLNRRVFLISVHFDWIVCIDDV